MSTATPPAGDDAISSYAQLTEHFLLRTKARNAASMFQDARRNMSPLRRHRLRDLLRDHRQKEVKEPDDIAARDSVDYLLAYYSALEIACLLGITTTDVFDSDFTDAARWVLEEPSVVEYYQTHYPVLLPQMFRRRLRGEQKLLVPGEHRAAFAQFLNVIAKLEHDDAVETFQWFLDDGKWDGYDIESLISLARHPSSFLERLQSTDTDRLTLAVDGLRTFFSFCSEFDALLADQHEAANELIASVFWHFEGYWLVHLAHRLGSHVGRIIDALSSWDGQLSDESDGPQSFKRVIERLASSRYDAPLRSFTRWDDDDNGMQDAAAPPMATA